MPESDVAEYWRHVWEVQEPWAMNCPATAKHIPIGLHGDAAKLWTQWKFEKVTAITLNVCHFRPRSIRCSRFLLFSCPHAKMVKNRTLNAVWKRLVWSLEACFDGVNPQTGFGGKPLTPHDQERAKHPLTRSGAKFAVCELRGDWEWHRGVWRTTASWQANDVCFRCPCVAKGGIPGNLYFAHGEGCAWSAEFNLQEFVSQRLRDNNLCS